MTSGVPSISIDRSVNGCVGVSRPLLSFIAEADQIARPEFLYRRPVAGDCAWTVLLAGNGNVGRKAVREGNVRKSVDALQTGSLPAGTSAIA